MGTSSHNVFITNDDYEFDDVMLMPRQIDKTTGDSIQAFFRGYNQGNHTTAKTLTTTDKANWLIVENTDSINADLYFDSPLSRFSNSADIE